MKKTRALILAFECCLALSCYENGAAGFQVEQQALPFELTENEIPEEESEALMAGPANPITTS